MKIMMLLISYDFPPDIRVEKEARALIAAGHCVTVVCENRKNRPAREKWHDIEIIRLPKQPVWWRQLNTACLFLFLRNPLWENAIADIVTAEKPDVIHIHDLPFVGSGLRIAKRSSLPVVVDLHENFPAHLETRRPISRNPLEWLAFSPQRFAQYEREILPHCDRVIVVVEEAAERIRTIGIPDEKIVVVSNTEDMDAVGPDHTDISLPTSEMKLLYVGGLQANRGLEVAILAISRIRKVIPTAILIIVGDGIFRPALEKLTRQLDLTQVVQFEGQQAFAKVHSYIRAGDVCLVPHTANAEIDTTIPHKLFQYMYMKKAVLVSSARPLSRIVKASRAGLVFESGNPESLADCILQLQDSHLRQKMGENGYRAVVDRYNWQRDGQNLVSLYQALFTNSCKRK